MSDETMNLDIYNTNISSDILEKMKEEILSCIFEIDKNGIIKINQDFRIMLMNEKCCMKEFVNTYFGWDDNCDIDFVCFKMDNSTASDKQDYIRDMLNFDKRYFKVNYMFIKITPISSYLFAVFCKNNTTKESVKSDLTLMDSNLNTNITKIFERCDNVDKTIVDFKKHLEENLSLLSDSIIDHKNIIDGKMVELEDMINNEKTGREQQVQSFNGDLETLKGEFVEQLNVVRDELLLKFKDVDEKIQMTDTTLSKYVDEQTQHLQEIYEQRYLSMENTLTTIQNNFNDKIQSLEENMTKKINDNINGVIDQISEIQISLQELLIIVLPNGKEFQRL